MGCHSLLQGIFPTQGSKPGLLHSRKILYHLSHQGSHQGNGLKLCEIPLERLKWTRPSNQETVECNATLKRVISFCLHSHNRGGCERGQTQDSTSGVTLFLESSKPDRSIYGFARPPRGNLWKVWCTAPAYQNLLCSLSLTYDFMTTTHDQDEKPWSHSTRCDSLHSRWYLFPH